MLHGGSARVLGGLFGFVPTVPSVGGKIDDRPCWAPPFASAAPGGAQSGSWAGSQNNALVVHGGTSTTMADSAK
jgi:hypothetical protein